MPIEIKELHIKAVVGGREKIPADMIKADDIKRLKKEIINEVIVKVFRILKQKNER